MKYFCSIRIKMYNSRDISDIQFVLTDGSKRGILLTNVHSSFYLNQSTPVSHPILNERLISNHMSMCLPKEHVIYHAFNVKIIQMVESGLAKKYVDDYIYKKKIAEQNGPVVLDLDHLGFGFLICLFCLLVAFLCFLIELSKIL